MVNIPSSSGLMREDHARVWTLLLASPMRSSEFEVLVVEMDRGTHGGCC